MRVLLLHPSDELYGADRIALVAADALQAAGHTITVVLPRDVDYPARPLSRELVARGVAVHRLDFPVLRRRCMTPRGFLGLLGRLLTSAPALWRLLRTSDLAYLNTSATLLAAPLARVADRPVLLHLHEHWKGAERALLDHLARLTAGRVIAVSAAVTRPLSASLARRTAIVHNGLEDRPALPHTAPDEEPMTLLVASRWSTWKGHGTLARAWGQGLAGWRLLVCGGPPLAGEAVDVPAAFAGAAGVSFCGEVADLAPLLHGCDAVVVPSDEPDPLPTIALEAMRAGRPVIASDVGGLREIIGEGGEAGWLFPARDARALRARLAALDRGECAALGAAARARFLQRFSRERFATELVANVEHAAEGNPSGAARPAPPAPSAPRSHSFAPPSPFR